MSTTDQPAASASAVPTGAWINARTRAHALESLAGTGAEPIDVLVIGGGVTGTGVALDAATRGLRVALVERRDLGSGTSGFSSKLVHGGRRYLAKGDVSIARESALERHRLLTTIAPHLARPAENLIPIGSYLSRRESALAMTGLRLGDALRRSCRTPANLLPPPSRISKFEVGLLAPAVSTIGLRGGLTYWDGQLEDDVRLVVALARTAAAHGAQIVTRCSASAVNPRSATLTDELSGESFIVHARTVINAGGVWAGDLEPDLTTTPSRGTHLVVRSERLGNPRAIVTVPVPGHFGRYVFAMPQPDGLTYLGLTDHLAPDADGYDVSIPAADEQFLLETINRALADPLGPADIIGRYAGLRPLVQTAKSSQSADISRRHLLIDQPGKIITIAGGKLTTYRQMAQDAVDAAARRLEYDGPCVTAELPLVGAADRQTLAGLPALPRLVRRFGLEAPMLQRLAADRPELLTPVVDGLPVLGIEVVFAARAEGALSVDDFLDRRVRAGFAPEDREALRWECTKLFDAELAALR